MSNLGTSLVSKGGAMSVREEALNKPTKKPVEFATIYGDYAKDFYKQVNDYHSKDEPRVSVSVDKLLIKQRQHDLTRLSGKPTYNDLNLLRFNPSGASKCERELFYKFTGVKEDENVFQPYHRRWLRNAEAVHSAMQRDLLLMGCTMDDPKFTVATAGEVLGLEPDDERYNLPAWELNMLSHFEYEHNGKKFLLNGMMDGVLHYAPEDKLIGFEYKTKSTTIATVGTYKMKDVQEAHKQQCISYSTMFFGDPYEERTDTFVVMYESLAKDTWMKGTEAREDFRTFQVEVSREERVALLDRFAKIVRAVEDNEMPEGDESKCLFCPFKSTCKGGK